MGFMVNGSGDIIAKKGKAVEAKGIIDGLVKVLDMSFRCEIEENDMLYVTEETEFWDEARLKNILIAVRPFITSGYLEYKDQEGCYWKYQYSAQDEKWNRLEGKNEYEPISRKSTYKIKTDNIEDECGVIIEDFLNFVGGNTKVEIIGVDTNGKDHCFWNGMTDDYNFETVPYGHQKVYHVTVMEGEDVLKIFFNYGSFTEDEQKELTEVKKYFHFCKFPSNGAEMLYLRYGKNTEEYVTDHFLYDLAAEVNKLV